jgi:two-component system, chemotaxis family, sensor kinase CheA
MTDDLSQDPVLVQEFLVESEELLQRMDQDMVELEATPGDPELLNRVFRALHTIKGTSGFLGFEAVVRLSHKAEDVLNALRKGEILLTRRMMDALLAARDCLGRMLGDIRSGGLRQYELEPLLNELEGCNRSGDPASPTTELPQPAETLSSAEKSPRAVENRPPAAETMSRSTRQNDASAHTMRVDVRKLDELINLVGELVLERNRLAQISRDLTARRVEAGILESVLGQSSARLSFITDELQSAGLRTRMVPIDTVFRKFPRLVRDIAHGLHKEVELQLHGQETELDKTMVELIGDPLVHLVRNSLDHGIEDPDTRVRSGKGRQGTIRLEARQEGDQIIISIKDDGAGIDPERIARKALEKGLVTSERLRTLSPREILDFIFLPGFSTAAQVSDISGRGVGMDVVRTNLKRLNGTVQLDSVLGQGTSVELRLPLTLAILPVLLVKLQQEVYALPLRSVVETARIELHEIHWVEGHEVLQLRGEILPVLRLEQLWSPNPSSDKPSSARVVVLGIGEQRVALLVDQLIGQESTVIKPLTSFLHHDACLAGATISGDGRVRLVLDPAGLLASANGSQAAAGARS